MWWTGKLNPVPPGPARMAPLLFDNPTHSRGVTYPTNLLSLKAQPEHCPPRDSNPLQRAELRFAEFPKPLNSTEIAVGSLSRCPVLLARDLSGFPALLHSKHLGGG